MKKVSIYTFAILFIGLSFSSCTQDENLTEKAIPADVLNNIARLGFSTDKIVYDEEDMGYIVEGDIFLSESDLESVPNEFRVPEAEQYHTFNLVTGTPRNISVFVAGSLGTAISNATDVALTRYNDENLGITFSRTSNRRQADIQIAKAGGNFLASAGFPTSGGDPFNKIKINSNAVSGQPQGTIASIIAHEIGHCIGFRHTDWFDRSISCGGAPTNEGQSTSGVGAVHIPNTPTGASNSAQSWMLSCIGGGQDRPFNNDDKQALDFLY